MDDVADDFVGDEIRKSLENLLDDIVGRINEKEDDLAKRLRAARELRNEIKDLKKEYDKISKWLNVYRFDFDV